MSSTSDLVNTSKSSVFRLALIANPEGDVTGAANITALSAIGLQSRYPFLGIFTALGETLAIFTSRTTLVTLLILLSESSEYFTTFA